MLTSARLSARNSDPPVAQDSSQTGSGTAIGVAMMFPMLMLVIVALHAITSATRTEQALQVAADRAAHAASLCCLHVDDAVVSVQNTVKAFEHPFPRKRLQCANDVSATASVTMVDVAGGIVPEMDANMERSIVPPGGLVQVDLTCVLPTSILGSFAVATGGIRRHAIGVASFDPYRHRFEQIGTGT